MKREQLKLKSIPNDTNWIEAMMEKGLDLLEVLKWISNPVHLLEFPLSNKGTL